MIWCGPYRSVSSGTISLIHDDSLGVLLKINIGLPCLSATFITIALLSGCSAPPADAEVASQQEMEASKTPITPVKPTKALSPEQKLIRLVRTDSAKRLKKDGVKVTSETRKNKNGEFPVLEVLPEAPIATFDPSLLKGKFLESDFAPETTAQMPAGWTDKEAAAAQLFAAQMAMDTMYNSPSNGDLDAHWKTDRLLKDVSTQDLAEQVDSPSDDWVMAVPGDKRLGGLKMQDGSTLDLQSFHDGKTPRIGGLSILPKAAGNVAGDLAFYFEGDLLWNTMTADKKQAAVVPYKISTTVTVVKSGEGFLVDGWSTNFTASPKLQEYVDG